MMSVVVVVVVVLSLVSLQSEISVFLVYSNASQRKSTTVHTPH